MSMGLSQLRLLPTTPTSPSISTPRVSVDSSYPKDSRQCLDLDPVKDVSECGGATAATSLESLYGSSIPDTVAVNFDTESPRAVNVKNGKKKEKHYELWYFSDGEAGPWCDMEGRRASVVQRK